MSRVAIEAVVADLDDAGHRMDDIGHLPPHIQRPIRRVQAALRARTDHGSLRRWIDRQAEVLGAARVASIQATICLHPQASDLPGARSALREMRRALRHEADPVERALGVEAWHRLSGGVDLREHRPHSALVHYRRALAARTSSSNVCNVLAANVRVGQWDDARALLHALRAAGSPGLNAAIDRRMGHDPDLAPIRGWARR